MIKCKIFRKPAVKINELNDVLNFGKYKGMTIEDIMNEDAIYLFWAEDEELIALDLAIRKLISKNAVLQELGYLDLYWDNQ